MVYASSRDALRRSLDGIGVEIQGTDYSEVSYEAGMFSLSRLLEPQIMTRSLSNHLSFQFWTR
jgi:hypothetical protein